jgi:cysteine dioxygenase
MIRTSEKSVIPNQHQQFTFFEEDKSQLYLSKWEEITSFKEKREITHEELKSLETHINEGLTKTSEIAKMRENVIDSLKKFDPAQYSWQKYFSFKDKQYTRNLVLQNELFELLIICWDYDCQTPIHDHPSNGCWMFGVKGRFNEEKFVANSEGELVKISHAELQEGDIAYIHDSIGLHSVGNSSKQERAVTLHLYSPPIKKCYVYKEDGVKFPVILKNQIKEADV